MQLGPAEADGELCAQGIELAHVSHYLFNICNSHFTPKMWEVETASGMWSVSQVEGEMSVNIELWEEG